MSWLLSSTETHVLQGTSRGVIETELIAAKDRINATKEKIDQLKEQLGNLVACES